jgi:tetratricopeptide (TPR) repeat protein
MLLLPCLLAVQVAHAAAKDSDKDSRDSKERAAKTACLSGDYAKGVAILAELYVQTNLPNYLFNQARCFMQCGKYSDAIVHFREFLLKNKDAGNASDGVAEKHIADCQALLDKEKDRTPATQATTPSQPLPAAQPAAADTPIGREATAPAAPPAPEIAQARASAAAPGSGLRIAGITVLAVGVAGIATGAVLNLKANSLASEIETTKPYQRSKENSRASYETFGWVGYGVGAACLAGGAVLYYLGYSKGRSPSVALLPTAVPGAAGAVLQGAF